MSDEEVDDVKSGWSSRRDSQISVEDEVLIEKLQDDLKQYIDDHCKTDQQMIREKLTKRLNEELEVPSVDEHKIKICSAHYMFNQINNNGDLVMFFDMRAMYSILRGHIDYNHNQDTNILLPCDYLLEKDLKIKDINTWLPDLVN